MGVPMGSMLYTPKPCLLGLLECWLLRFRNSVVPPKIHSSIFIEKIPKDFGQINGRHYGFSPKFTVRALEGILVS